MVAPGNAVEIAALEADRGECLGYIRVVGRRNGEVVLGDIVESIPPSYTRHPLLRGDD